MKIFYYVWFDIVVLKIYFGIEINLVFCIKIVFKFVCIYIDWYGFKDVCKELLNVDFSK